MTSKDKTGDQLVASIRKSKTGAVTRKNTERTEAKASRTEVSVKKPAKKTTVEPSMSGSDSFSYGHRVWPD